MSWTRRLIFTVALASAASLGPASVAEPIAPVQSESELLQKNQRLEQRVQQLEAELAAAMAHIQSLERDLAQSKEPTPGSTPTAPNGSGAPAAPALPVDATVPTTPPAPSMPVAAPPRPPASPFDNSATVLDAVRARFAADFAGKPAPRDGENDERLTRLWMTEIERWITMLNRELRRPIVWNVRIVSAESLARSWRLEVICVDPATRADVGKPFPIQLQHPQSSSLETSQRLGTADGDFTLRGVYVPQIVINPTRFDVGPFDLPPFIGPFLEYGFRISVTSLVQAERRGARKSAPANSAPAPGSPGSSPAAPPPAPPAGAPATPPSSPPPPPAPSDPNAPTRSPL